MTLEKVLYTAKAHTTGGRDGASRSSDSIPPSGIKTLSTNL
jgi:organic hydroperoxide reductase OsmC/OhrA